MAYALLYVPFIPGLKFFKKRFITEIIKLLQISKYDNIILIQCQLFF